MQLQIVKNVVVVVSALLGTSIASSVKEEATAALRGASYMCIRPGEPCSVENQNCCCPVAACGAGGSICFARLCRPVMTLVGLTSSDGKFSVALPIDIDEGVWVATRGLSVNLPDAYKDPRFSSQLDQSTDSLSTSPSAPPRTNSPSGGSGLVKSL
jgi:hypothetical protein